MAIEGGKVVEIYTDEHTGYRCMVWQRTDTLTYNGYVEVPVDHPDVIQSLKDQYASDDLFRYEVHGGVTWCGQMGNDKWGDRTNLDGHCWVGFDCAHYGDDFFNPVKEKWQSEIWPDSGYVKRTEEYVRMEIAYLAKQLKHREHCEQPRHPINHDQIAI